MAGALASSASSHAEELDKTRAELAQMRHEFARETERLKISQNEVCRRETAIVGLREHIQIKERDLCRLQQRAEDLQQKNSSLELQLEHEKTRSEDESCRFRSALKISNARTEEFQDAAEVYKKDLETLRAENSHQLCQRNALAQNLHRTFSTRMEEEQRKWEEGNRVLNKAIQNEEMKMDKLKCQLESQKQAEMNAHSQLEIQLAVSEQRWKSAEKQSAQLQAAVKQVAIRRDRVAAEQAEALAKTEHRVQAELRESHAMVRFEQSAHKTKLVAYAGVAERAMRNMQEEMIARCSKLEHEHKLTIDAVELQLETQAQEELRALRSAECAAFEALKQSHGMAIAEVSELKASCSKAEAYNENHIAELDAMRSELLREHANESTAIAKKSDELRVIAARLAAAKHSHNRSEQEVDMLKMQLHAAEEKSKLHSLIPYSTQIEARGDTGGSREGPIVQPTVGSKEFLQASRFQEAPLHDSLSPRLEKTRRTDSCLQEHRLELLQEELASSKMGQNCLEASLSAANSKLHKAMGQVQSLEEVIRDAQQRDSTHEAEVQRLAVALGRAESVSEALRYECNAAKAQLAVTNAERDTLIEITNELRADLNRAKVFPQKIPSVCSPLVSLTTLQAAQVMPSQHQTDENFREMITLPQHQEELLTPPKVVASVRKLQTKTSSISKASWEEPGFPMPALAASDRATASQSRINQAANKAQQR
eukprot:gnl/MRDRNA2_/MRDRNA2_93449_c0_seq1.p1 gnl/MRDRNA2_/MRDRNA2_93449_c0~~gnl/MRDRNA2_/MRDRNA2_93449_c0_seq1.p1  ORF type:complete len:752 (-),score=194.45 gnl/MRDRNA2_/MRDRNA2_93449_c0_seq1:109-2244(-)